MVDGAMWGETVLEGDADGNRHSLAFLPIPDPKWESLPPSPHHWHRGRAKTRAPPGDSDKLPAVFGGLMLVHVYCTKAVRVQNQPRLSCARKGEMRFVDTTPPNEPSVRVLRFRSRRIS